MKLLTFWLLFCSIAAADPCGPAELATYLTPGFACSLDGVTFSNFSFSSISYGTAGVVTPSNTFVDISNVGFRFESDQFWVGDPSSPPPNSGFQQSVFSYRVTGDIMGMLLSWWYDTSNDHTGPLWYAFETPHDLSLNPECCFNYEEDTATFLPEGTLNVTDTFVLQAGDYDYIELSWLGNEFSPVPEPTTLSLVGVGLVWLGRKLLV